MPKYWEDYNIGEKFEGPGRTISEATIETMAALSGHTMFLFWDEERCRDTVFGGRIAPGLMTVLVMDGLEEQSGVWDEETVIALAGIDGARIKAPLRAGDTIRTETEIVDKKETKNPERGLIFHKNVCRNQRGEEVAEYQGTHFVKRRR